MHADRDVQPSRRQNLIVVLLGLGKLVVKLEKHGYIAEGDHRLLFDFPRVRIPLRRG